MDEVIETESGRINPPALENRHPLLHPQQRAFAAEHGKEKAGRPTIARGRGE